MVHPGDCLIFQVGFDPKDAVSRTVNSHGDVFVPSIGTLHVAGRTVEQVAQAARDRFEPWDVHIEVSECRP